MGLDIEGPRPPTPAQPVAPQPGAPKPRESPVKIAARVMIIVVVFAAFGGAIFGLVMWLSADMRDTTHRFLGHVRGGRDDRAYSMLTQRRQAQVPQAAFASYVGANAPRLRSSRSEWINGFTGGDDRQCMEVWLEHGATGDDSTLYVLLEKEGGAWKVDEITEIERDECDSD